MKKARVLVIRGGAIGDFVVTLPVLHLLRTSLPGCHITVFGYRGIAELALRAGLADEVRHLGDPAMATLFVPGATVAEELKAFLVSHDLVVSYLYDPDGIFAANLEGLGVKTLLACPHRMTRDGGPAPMQLARPLERLAMFLEDTAPWMSGAARERGQKGFQGPPRTVLLHLGSGSLEKNWSLTRWHEALSRAAWQLERLILISGEAEEERGLLAEARALTWPARHCEHWHQVPLVTLSEQMEELAGQGSVALFLGHDSGISHLAAACGLPCALLFGPSEPQVWVPQNPGVHFLRGPQADLENLEPATVLHWWAQLFNQSWHGDPE
jgi:heptosyltransferase-3